MSMRTVVSIILCLLLSHSWAMSQRQSISKKGRDATARDKKSSGGKRVIESTTPEKEFAVHSRKHRREWEILVREAYAGRRSGLVEMLVWRVPTLSVKTLSLNLAEVFKPGTAVLFYHFGGNLLRVWLIDRDGLRAHHQVRLSEVELDTAISELRDTLEVLTTEADDTFSGTVGDLAHKMSVEKLTARLLPPAVAEPLRSVRHLIVVPTRGIGAVPFGLLTPFGPGKTLIELMSVTIAPSLYDVIPKPSIERSEDRLTPWRKWDRVIQGALIVGNPALPAEWTKLPAAERETAAVARELGGQHILTGPEATKENVVRRANLRRQGRIELFYFATHSVAFSDDPRDGGFIVLAGEGGIEARWTAREILQQGRPVKLVVLSACQTGLGKEFGAGISGLARAFHLAGSPRVVMSLWSIHDDSTAELMPDFVSRLRSYPPAEALRLAMLELRKKRPNPAHWAAFSLFGTPL